MITIKNLRQERPSQPWDVRVDRSSALGNPFRLSYDGGRDIVCNAYERYFYNQLEKEDFAEDFAEELGHLIHLYVYYGKLNLFCWCAPKRCHAETIKNYLEEALNT